MTLIKAKIILRGFDLTPLEGHSILLEKDKIKQILPSEKADAMIQPNWTVWDLGDSTVLPGLIDCHSHLSLDARTEEHLFKMEDSECIQTIRSIKNLKDDLLSGITTMRSMGDRYYLDTTIRDLIRSGEVEGPSLKVCGVGMKGLHGHGFVGKSFSGSEEFRKVCRENLYHNVDWLKIFMTGGSPPDGKHIPWFLTPGEVETVVYEAKASGKRTAAHCVGGEGLKICVEKGIDTIEHAYCATESDAELMLKHSQGLCLTPGIFMDETREPYCPPGFVQKVHTYREQVMNSMSILIQAGIPFALGSDAYHGLMDREIRFACDLGATPVRALQGATSQAARILDISGKGYLEEGMSADIIATKSNPLADLSTLKNVHFVMKDGEVFKSLKS